MIERPDAARLLAGPLGQWLKEQDDLRAETRAKASKWQKRGIAAAMAVAVAVILFTNGGIWAALQFGFFTGLAGFGIAELIKLPVLNKLKGGINGAIADALGLQFSAEVQPGDAFARAETFKLLPNHDNARFEDLWWGNIGNLAFSLHEAKLTEQRGGSKNRRTVTVFEGSLMLIAFARPFVGTTLVERSGRHQGFLMFGEREELELGGVQLRRADMTDPRFEDAFTVWSSDGVEARYLVHPDYIERLVAVEQAFAGQKIRALFHEGALLVILETGNLFESGSLEASEDHALVERSIAQFTALADLATKLNERPRASFN